MKKVVIFLLLIFVIFILGGIILYILDKDLSAMTENAEQTKILNVSDKMISIEKDFDVYYLKNNSELYKINTQILNEEKVFNNVNNFSISPDGNKIVVVSKESTSSIYIIDLLDLKQILVKSDINCKLPEWSYDSNKIAYTYKNNSEYRIEVYDINTYDFNLIHQDYETDYEIVWRKNNNLIYGNLYREHFEYNLESNRLKDITNIVRRQNIFRKKSSIFDDLHFNKRGKYVYENIVYSQNSGYQYFTKEGSLFVKKNTDNDEELLVKYDGDYNNKFSSRIQNILSVNDEYILFNFKK